MSILGYTIIVGLAAYRLYRLPAEDIIAQPFRNWLDPRAERSVAWSYLSDLIYCSWCSGYWWAGLGAWLVADMADYSPLEFALVWLGGSTVCGVLRAILERLTR